MDSGQLEGSASQIQFIVQFMKYGYYTLSSTEQHEEFEVLSTNDVPAPHVVRNQGVLPADLGLNLRLLLQTIFIHEVVFSLSY